MACDAETSLLDDITYIYSLENVQSFVRGVYWETVHENWSYGIIKFQGTINPPDIFGVRELKCSNLAPSLQYLNS